MARWNELPWREEVYAAAEVWKERCFFGDRSLFNDRPVWTEENFKSLDGLTVQNPLYDLKNEVDKKQNPHECVFLIKLKLQLSGRANDKTIQLAAELFWFINLISTNGTAKKREIINRICSWRSLAGEGDTRFLRPDVLKGIANPGSRFSPSIFKNFVYMISMMIEWKTIDLAVRNRFLSADEEWSFANWWDQS